jgi:UDP-2,4-diacetamido-2,4,6-trideoxy-beta-L-altropyranose hydrolase
VKVAFRVDASLDMGIGHVMRCLTLADAVKAEGGQCTFVCREHDGHLLELINQRGHDAIGFPAEQMNLPSTPAAKEANGTRHANWLGSTWEKDAELTFAALQGETPDWLVADHYALDARWERVLRTACRKLMVIDDLADRRHDCDLLLDQNLGRQAQDYAGRVPAPCPLLIGPDFALLRPEFSAWREYSLQRRKSAPLKRLLITMGGVDQPDATSQVLSALRDCPLPADCAITVVMGPHALWLAGVQEIAETMPWPTEVRVGVSDMVRLMAESDLAIGAAGSTSWERCCLGLPTLMVVLAENQRQAALHLENAHAAVLMELGSGLESNLAARLDALIGHDNLRNDLVLQSSRIVDGAGTKRVLTRIFEC